MNVSIPQYIRSYIYESMRWTFFFTYTAYRTTSYEKINFTFFEKIIEWTILNKVLFHSSNYTILLRIVWNHGFVLNLTLENIVSKFIRVVFSSNINMKTMQEHPTQQFNFNLIDIGGLVFLSNQNDLSDFIRIN